MPAEARQANSLALFSGTSFAASASHCEKRCMIAAMSMAGWVASVIADLLKGKSPAQGPGFWGLTKTGRMAVTGHSRRPPEAMSAIHSRSEEQTSELQSLMRISFTVFCLKQKQH